MGSFDIAGVFPVFREGVFVFRRKHGELPDFFEISRQIAFGRDAAQRCGQIACGQGFAHNGYIVAKDYGLKMAAGF